MRYLINLIAKKFSNILVLLLFLLILINTIGSAYSKNLIISEGEGTVPIINENQVRAKEEAIGKAKEEMLRGVLKEFLHPEQIVLSEELIKTKFLRNPDIFIESTQIVNEFATEDPPEFTVKIKARIFRSRIVGFLKKINLPLLIDPPKKCVVLYDPKDEFWRGSNKHHLLNLLNTTLDSFRFSISRSIAFSPKSVLSSKKGEQLPLQLLRGITTPFFFLIDFSPDKYSKNISEKAPLNINLQLRVFNGKTGIHLKSFSISNKIVKWEPQDNLKILITNLSQKLFEALNSEIFSRKGSGQWVHLKIRGLPYPQAEHNFINEVFKQKTIWNQFSLEILNKDYSVYRGKYLGNLEMLEQELLKINKDNYQISKITHESGQYILDINWKEKIISPIEFQPKRTLQEWLDNNKDYSSLSSRVPATLHRNTCLLPHNTLVYDYIRNRGDSSLFKVEAKQGDKLQIKWNRVGITKLRPMITIYDALDNPIKRYFPKKKKMISFFYNIPVDQSIFFIKISDEIGYVQGISGSYNYFHYIIQIIEKNNSD